MQVLSFIGLSWAIDALIDLVRKVLIPVVWHMMELCLCWEIWLGICDNDLTKGKLFYEDISVLFFFALEILM